MSDLSNGKASNLTPPYLVFSTLITFADNLKNTVIPNQIDNHVMAKVGGGARPVLLSTLRYFGWIEADNNRPTVAFRSFVNADDASRKVIMREALKSGYPSVFNDNVDLNTVTAPELEKLVAPEAKGDTIRKCFAFFTGAADYANIPLGEYAKKKRGGSRGRRGSRSRITSGNGGGDSDLVGDDKLRQESTLADPIPIPITPSRTWYVQIEKDYSTSDVKLFLRIVGMVLGNEEEV